MNDVIRAIKSWNGGIVFNDTMMKPTEIDFKAIQSGTRFTLLPKSKCASYEPIKEPVSHHAVVDNDSTLFKVQVRQYMTKPSTPQFDFMKKWNNDNPMPLRVMVGEQLKETPGMVYMRLHGDILESKTRHCMKCGKVISNPISQFFGMGPECGNHAYINPFETEDELNAAVESYKQKLQKITWEGWIIKSAIEKKEVL